MRGDILGNGEQGKSTGAWEPVANRASGSPGQHTATDDIDRLYVHSRRGLWGICFFLAASIIAFVYRDHGLTGCLGPVLREQLGLAPPVFLVTAILVVSTLSALVIIAGRIYNGRKPGSTWINLVFWLFFYLLFFAVDSLSEHFHAVFTSGLAIMALQHYSIWDFTSRAIEKRLAFRLHPTPWGGGVGRR